MHTATLSSNKTISAPLSSHVEPSTALRCAHCGYVIDGTPSVYHDRPYHNQCGEYVSHWGLENMPIVKGDD